MLRYGRQHADRRCRRHCQRASGTFYATVTVTSDRDAAQEATETLSQHLQPASTQRAAAESADIARACFFMPMRLRRLSKNFHCSDSKTVGVAKTSTGERPPRGDTSATLKAQQRTKSPNLKLREKNAVKATENDAKFTRAIFHVLFRRGETGGIKK